VASKWWRENWAGDVADARLRVLYLELVGKVWMKSDPPAARAWIAQTPLDDSTKARMLAMKP